MRIQTGSANSIYHNGELIIRIRNLLPKVTKTIATYFTPTGYNDILNMLSLLEKNKLLESTYLGHIYDDVLNLLLLRAIHDNALISCYRAIVYVLDSLDALTIDNMNKTIHHILSLSNTFIKFLSDIFYCFFNHEIFDKSTFNSIFSRMTPTIMFQVITIRITLDDQKENILSPSSYFELEKEQWNIIIGIADTEPDQLTKIRDILNFLKFFNELSTTTVNDFFQQLANAQSRNDFLDSFLRQLHDFTYFNFSDTFCNILAQDIFNIRHICLCTTLPLTSLSCADENALDHLFENKNNIKKVILLEALGIPLIYFFNQRSEFQKIVFENFVNIALFLQKNACAAEEVKKTIEEIIAHIDTDDINDNDLNRFQLVKDFFERNPDCQTDFLLLEMLFILSSNRLMDDDTYQCFELRISANEQHQSDFNYFFDVVKWLASMDDARKNIKHLTHDNFNKVKSLFVHYTNIFYILHNYFVMNLITDENFNDFFNALTSPDILMVLHSFFDFLISAYKEFRKIPPKRLIFLVDLAAENNKSLFYLLDNIFCRCSLLAKLAADDINHVMDSMEFLYKNLNERVAIERFVNLLCERLNISRRTLAMMQENIPTIPLLEHFDHYVDTTNYCEDIGINIQHFNLLTPEEQYWLIKNWNDVRKLSGSGKSIQEILTLTPEEMTRLLNQQTRAGAPVNGSALFHSSPSQPEGDRLLPSPLAQSASSVAT